MTQLTMPAAKTSIDRAIHAQQGRFTQGLAPASLLVAYADWVFHLLNSPGKLGEMTENAAVKGLRFILWAFQCSDPKSCRIIDPLPQDRRFQGAAWQQWPFNALHQSFLMAEQWWHYATSGIPGVNRHHEEMVGFTARQLLDVFSPSNYLWSNPEVMAATAEQGGMNLARGWNNLIEDLQQNLAGHRRATASEYKVGENIAVTPGKVVFKNRLIELIQYAPATAKVHPEPVLIVPAWIMKYYILDLSPQNSLVKHLVEHGHTVFMISWKNPGIEERNLSMEDYLKLGFFDVLDAIDAICGKPKVHAVGYCLGGTLLAIAAAAMAGAADDRLKSISLFTAQTDFSEAGELMLFIDEGQISFMEDVMWDRGFLDTHQMAGAFQLLRSNDLIWSRMVREYLLGEREKLNDLMTWNADATRMPYRMHSEYLRRLFLNNDLAAGRYEVGGRPIAIKDIKVPIFCVSTTRDHVAPWKSVYKIHLLSDTDVTFVLASGGHNAGIVSEPGRKNRSFQIATTGGDDRYIDADEWAGRTATTEGSWWTAWQPWLAQRSGAPIAPPAMGAPKKGYRIIGDAPGTYVFGT